MIDCLILGDQIADGMRNYVSGCVPITYQNITSNEFAYTHGYSTMVNGNHWQVVIISLGINDIPDGNHTKRALRDLRHQIDADAVYWILPPESTFALRMAVHNVAMGRLDSILETNGWQREYPTPAGFREMANKINK